MDTSRRKALSAGIERVRVELANWREHRIGGRRIPEDVWVEAARAARQYGVNRVSKALGLDYSQLKRRAGGGARTTEPMRGAGPVFVELEGLRPETGLACVVELEKGNGARMRICARETVAVDWGKLKEAFLGA